MRKIRGNAIMKRADEPERQRNSIDSEEVTKLIKSHQQHRKIPSVSQREIDRKANEEDVLKHDGSVPLSSPWDIGENQDIKLEKLKARNSEGIHIYSEDEGTYLFIFNNGLISREVNGIATFEMERSDSSPAADEIGIWAFLAKDSLNTTHHRYAGIRAWAEDITYDSKDGCLCFEALVNNINRTHLYLGGWKVGVRTTAPGGLLGLKDENTYIDVDESGNMSFTDAIAGTRLLKNLGCPNYKFIKATNQAEGDLHLSDPTTWNVSRALLKVIRVMTSSTDWDLWILQNDSGYAADDANIPKMQVKEAGNGDADIYLDLPYEDEDNSGEVHLYYIDNSGAATADIYVIGYELV